MSMNASNKPRRMVDNGYGLHKRTDNAHFWAKVALRREAVLAHVAPAPVRVLDCFGGENRLWKEVGCAEYFGVESQKGKGGLNLHADNLRVIPALDLSRFNVVDLDSYGVPGAQLMALAANPTLPDGILVVYTSISAPLASGNAAFLAAMGVPPETFRRCPTLFNRRLNWFFDRFLALHLGVGRDRCVEFREGSYLKRYGYFVLARRAP